MAHTLFILSDCCLTNYILLGIMKSTLIFRMLFHNTTIFKTVENSSDCLLVQKYLQIHTHAVETFIILFFTKQISATYAQQRYLHWREQKYAHKTVNWNRKLQEKNALHSLSSLSHRQAMVDDMINWGCSDSFESCCLLWPWPPLPALPLTLPPPLILTLPVVFSAYFLIEVVTITVTIVWPGGT